MKVIGTTILNGFVGKHSDVSGQVASWVGEVKAAHWKNPAEIKARYATASFLGDNHVVFNLKGNKYRLEVIVGYRAQVVLVKRIGTHAEYSKW